MSREVITNVDHAMRETLEKSPDTEVYPLFYEHIIEQIDPQYFTAKNGGRQAIQSVTSEQVIEEVVLFVSQVVTYWENIRRDITPFMEPGQIEEHLSGTFPYYSVKGFLQKVLASENIFDYLATGQGKRALQSMCGVFTKYRYELNNKDLMWRIQSTHGDLVTKVANEIEANSKRSKDPVLNNIDIAMKKTMEIHPDFSEEAILSEQIMKEITPRCFTSQDGARDRIKNLTTDDYIKAVLRHTLRLSSFFNKTTRSLELQKIPRLSIREVQYCNNISKIINENSGINLKAYLQANPKILSSLIRVFVKTRYKENKYLPEVDKIALPDIVQQKIESDFQTLSSCRNLRVNKKAFDNACREEILNGKQIQLQRSEYALSGEMFAASDVGKERNNQEDSVLITYHPANPNFKMLVVSDGMGGHDAGELASNYVARSILKWFEELSPEYYSNEELLQEKYTEAIRTISDQLRKRYPRAGATFSGAIVGKDKTIISNVGDSRVYTSKNGELYQITEDDSYVNQEFKEGIIEQKDDMRFRRGSNVITECMGSPIGRCQSYLMNNEDYDVLMLFSDGVTDCLSDPQIKAITKHTSREELAKAIVDSALSTDSLVREELRNNPQYSQRIYGGKDNTTAAVYAPKR